MTSSIERRLERLEAEVAANKGHRMPYMIFPEDVETHEDAIIRAGHEPGDPSKFFIMIVPMTKEK